MWRRTALQPSNPRRRTTTQASDGDRRWTACQTSVSLCRRKAIAAPRPATSAISVMTMSPFAMRRKGRPKRKLKRGLKLPLGR